MDKAQPQKRQHLHHDDIRNDLHIFIVTHLEGMIDERMQFRKWYFRNKVAAFSLAVSL